VIAVSATDVNDIWAGGRAYNYGDNFEIDVAAPGIDVITTDLSQNYQTVSGTSFSTPHVSALAGLITTLNPQLLVSQVKNIIINTAVDVNQSQYPGHDEYIGHGRINAYQALLLTHAYSNKSASSTATAQNNGRRLVKTSDGKYHLVYESGITSGGNVLSEIFYRNYNGTNWSTPIRLSTGNEQNRYPCITVSGNNLYVAWQRKNGSTHDILYRAYVSGVWNSVQTLLTSVSSNDPLPVIQASVTTQNCLMIVFRDGRAGWQGLTAFKTTQTNPIPSNWTATHLPGTGMSHFQPSLAGVRHYYGENPNFGLAYATTTGAIYYSYYQNTTGSWNAAPINLSSIVPGSNLTHETPSLTGTGTGSTILHVAWHRIIGSGSSNYDHAIIYRKSSSFDTWPSSYTAIYYEQQKLPSITALDQNKVDVLFQLTGSDQIYKQHYDGYSWGAPVFAGSGRYPSVSTGNTTAKYVWTNGGFTPYAIQLSTETLSKEASDYLPYYSRSIAWLDGSGAYLEMQVQPISMKLKDGTVQKLEFVLASLDSFQLTSANAWDFLASSAALFPANAESLFVDYTIVAEKIEKTVASNSANRRVNIKLGNANGQPLFATTGALLPTSGTIAKTKYRVGMRLNGALSAMPLQLSVDLKGLTPAAGIFASLGHIYDFTKTRTAALSRLEGREKESAPQAFMLFENYPDPFNPATTIKYRIPEVSPVVLKVYNVVGQEILTLVDQVEDAGSHEIRWDGRDRFGQTVPSGVYLYRLQVEKFSAVKKMLLVQ